jgi:mRNA interferase YafQ
MLIPVLAGAFSRDLKRAEKRGKDLGKLRTLITLLASQEELATAYRDHPLRGRWNGFRDAHVEPDWILIYRVQDEELQLARTGTHSDLFDE